MAPLTRAASLPYQAARWDRTPEALLLCIERARHPRSSIACGPLPLFGKVQKALYCSLVAYRPSTAGAMLAWPTSKYSFQHQHNSHAENHDGSWLTVPAAAAATLPCRWCSSHPKKCSK